MGIFVDSSDKDLDLAQLRGSLDLLLRVQRFGRTGYIVSNIQQDRVFWSDSLFEQRKVPRRPYFTLAEGLAFIHPDDRETFMAARLQAQIDGREFEHDLRVVCGDGSIIWERGNSQPQFDANGTFTGLLSVVDDVTDSRAATASLMEQEATYRALFNGIGDGIFLMLDGTFVDCNDAALRMFGCGREDLVGAAPGRFSPERQPDGQLSSEKAARKMTDAVAGERQFFEWRHKRLDNVEFDAEVTLTRVQNLGAPYFFGVVRDITERKRAEAALLASHDKFAGAFGSSTDAMVVFQVGRELGGGIFLDANTAASRMFGLPRNTLIGKSVRETGLLTDDAVLLEFRERMARDGHVDAFEARLKRTDNSIRETEISASMFGAPRDQLAILVIRDVTEQREAARKIRELNSSLDASVRQLRAIADNLPVGIGYTDLDGKIQFLNKTAQSWLAINIEEARGRPANELFPQDYVDATAPMREAFAAGLANIERTLPMPDGVTRVVDATNIPDIDETGVLRGHFGLTLDVTERKKAEAELKASHDKFSSAFEFSTDAMWVSQVGEDLLSDITVDVNRSAEVMLDVVRTDVIGKTFPEPFQPTTTAQLREYRSQILEHGSVRDFPVTFTTDAGAPFETLLSGSTFLLGDKRHMLTLLRDVTEKKRAEDELRASHEKFASAFEYSTDAMWVSTVGDTVWAATIVDINRSAANMLGIDRHAVIGQPLSALRQGDGTQDLVNYRTRMLADGYVRDFPVTLRRSNGEPFDALISGSRFMLRDRVHTLTIIHDVSEARAAERQILALNDSLEASVRQLRAIADNIPVAISYQDPQGRFQFTNRTMEGWFGTTEAEMSGKTIHAFVSPTYLEAIKPIRERRNSGQMRSEVTLPYPDGRTRTVELNFVDNRSSAGELLGYYTLAIDMTERKAAEEQFNQSQKMQAVGKLTGGVAHDFNNLLAVISGNLDLVSAALARGEGGVDKLLATARRAAERGSTLTRSLLAFSRQQPLSPQVTDLNALARDTTELLRRTLPSNIGIEFVGGAGLWNCEVDHGQMQNALLNLVVNSRDAMPEGGRLTIETRNARVDADYAAGEPDLAPGQYVMLAVSDTGQGMPQDVIARAFEPFFTTKGTGQGTGLGLSMVYGFAKQSGGHVSIYSEVGSGTTVRLYLPRWTGDAAKVSPTAERTAPSAQNETLLVVEDDEDMRFIAVTMLRSLGYTVLEAPSGPKGLDILDKHGEIALLVSDVILAGSMNGRKLAEEARRRRPDIKVLYMSGYTEDAIVHHGRLDRGVHFIQKPFRKNDLALKAREALEQPV